jgi:hypothetical protein
LHRRGARRRVRNRDASYFETIRLPLLSGRPISDSDDSKAAGVLVSNERAAHECSPGQASEGQQSAFEGACLDRQPEVGLNQLTSSRS